MINIIKRNSLNKMEDFRKSSPRSSEFMDPIEVNAAYYPEVNSINIPVAILCFPLYNLGLEELNYGAIGTILGHEFIHGFDNIGRKYDQIGNYRNWWTNATLKTFTEKAECLVNQYNNFTIAGVPSHINGRQTLSENMADNGGLYHAFRSYHRFSEKHEEESKLPGFEDFTNHQLFFIAFSSVWCGTMSPRSIQKMIEVDVHSPPSIRILGALQNSREFSEAFQCALGSKMNPTANKCKVW